MPWEKGPPSVADDPLSPVYETKLQVDTYALSTAIYAERDDGKILLLQRAEGTAMAGFHFLPGGIVDPGEEPFGAAARELLEESGLRFDSEPQMVGCYPLFIYGRDFVNLTFRGRVTGELTTSDEHTGHQWVDPHEWAALFTPEAIDAMADGNDQIALLLTGIGRDARRYLNLVTRAD